MAALWSLAAGFFVGSKSGPKQESDTSSSNVVSIVGSHNTIVNLYEAKEDHRANFILIEVGLELLAIILVIAIVYVVYKKYIKR